MVWGTWIVRSYASALRGSCMAEGRVWYLVCYDIRDPQRWRRCFKLLKGYGEGLQYSIFRCRLDMTREKWTVD